MLVIIAFCVLALLDPTQAVGEEASKVDDSGLGLNTGLDVADQGSSNGLLGLLQRNVTLCNEMDDGSGTGVCVDPDHCAKFGGRNLGTCSSVAGLKFTTTKSCCQKVTTCGEASSAQVAYFRNPRYPNCQTTELSCNTQIAIRAGVCQLRLDFLDFQMSPTDQCGVCNGQDNMRIVSGGVSQRLCGNNAGNHMYLSVKPQDIVTLSGRMSNTGSPCNKWNIKATQIDCESGLPFFRNLRAPDGCQQFYRDSVGKIKSYNFGGSSRFGPDQSYTICIDNRRQNRNCGINYKALSFGLPVLGGDIAAAGCRAGTSSTDPAGRICCNDNSASITFTAAQGAESRRMWCGARLGTGNTQQTKSKPFNIQVFSPDMRALCPNGQLDTAALGFEPVGFELEYSYLAGTC